MESWRRGEGLSVGLLAHRDELPVGGVADKLENVWTIREEWSRVFWWGRGISYSAGDGTGRSSTEQWCQQGMAGGHEDHRPRD